MAKPSAINFTLLPAHHGKRVRIDSPNNAPIHVLVGDLNEAWLAGTYIEVVRLPSCTADVQLVAANGVVLNILKDSMLTVGQCARVSMVVPGEWDLQQYPVANYLDDLRNVDTVTNIPADGNALVFDGVLGTWKPGTVGGGNNLVQTNQFTG